ncbi:MAG: histidinol-phosphate transaminase [Chloroflexota bacterium]
MSDAIDRLLSSRVAKVAGYVSLEPVEVLKKGAGRVIKLDGNENPYGCSPRVREALSRYPHFHIYPDPEQRELRQALEAYTGVGQEHIIAGAGSDELIDLMLRLLIDPGDRVINCPPTFGMYAFSTQVCGGEVVSVPRDEHFGLDVSLIEKAVDKKTKVVFMASPNNPSGNIAAEADILALLKKDMFVVVDEAYFEFSGVTMARLVPRFPNLVVLRTFSKWAGLAGLRVGYGLFPAAIVPEIMKIKQPYNVSAAAQVAALESLADRAYLEGTVKAIVAERARLMSGLSRISWLKPYASQANFILCRVVDGNARTIHGRLRQQGIFVRYFDTPELRDCLRITAGKPEESDALLQALKEVRNG